MDRDTGRFYTKSASNLMKRCCVHSSCCRETCVEGLKGRGREGGPCSRRFADRRRDAIGPVSGFGKTDGIGQKAMLSWVP